MLEGMYTAAAGMEAQQRRLDALANDVANVNTAGYRPMRQAFRDLLYGQGGIATDNVQLGTGAAVRDLGRATGQGSLQLTAQPLDVALQGPGFFQVRGADGTTQLTRSGNLHADERGQITTASGQLLEPPVRLPAGTDVSKLAIGRDGAIMAGDREIGRLRLVTVTSPGNLRPVGETSFAITPESGPARAAGNTTSVVQGSLEMSSVDLGDTMTNMIQSQRAYEMASRVITMQDKVAEAAIGVKR